MHELVTAGWATATYWRDAGNGVESLEAGFFAPEALPADVLPVHRRWLADSLAGQAAAFVR